MAAVTVLDTGIVYRNPKPHVRSVHAYFPSVAETAAGDLVASVVLGEAFESVDSHTHICRSTDGGSTWTLEGPIYPGTADRLTSDSSRLTALADGTLVAFMIRCDRSEHPDEGLTNPASL
ncbi:MAG: exo-alpha-sialidase, partial [Candidatus Hydrogenedentes bacterium]|nr:exo-alpha-sialidase [Candidatus Hydrogenedentota bacterium]